MTAPLRRAAVVLLVLALAACGARAEPDAAPGATGTGPGTPIGEELTGTVTVLAAASLTDVLTELATRVEQQHPSLEVRVSTGGSASLAQQVLAGVPADVLVTADRATMATVTHAGAHAAEPALLAHNALELAVPADNPAGIRSLADLARDDVTVALCAPQVPCGAASAVLLANAGVTVTPATLEKDVRAVLTKVRLGEVDAGLVYRTDAAAAGDDVVGLPVPGADDVVNDYLVAPLADAPNPAAADAFVALLLGNRGREVLGAAGFGLP